MPVSLHPILAIITGSGIKRYGAFSGLPANMAYFALNLRTFVNMAHSWLGADSLLSACEWAENGTLQFA
jgi:hypothetical protein